MSRFQKPNFLFSDPLDKRGPDVLRIGRPIKRDDDLDATNKPFQSFLQVPLHQMEPNLHLGVFLCLPAFVLVGFLCGLEPFSFFVGLRYLEPFCFLFAFLFCLCAYLQAKGKTTTFEIPLRSMSGARHTSTSSPSSWNPRA